MYGALLTFAGDRAILLDIDGEPSPAQIDALRECIALALTYHLRARPRVSM
jgi:hypothetical protein